MKWHGVMPAITTPFDEAGAIDHAFVVRHVAWLVDAGCTGIVPCGSLGEGATLDHDEKVALISSCVEGAAGRAPVVPGIAAASTRAAIRLARDARAAGARGLMVLPPYVHKGPDAEILGHVEAVIEEAGLDCMLYNNPIAYGADFTPPVIARLAERHANLAAVKDSSGDLRRFTAVRALVGDRLATFAGLDDLVVEAVAAGAKGWVAGLVNALPRESVVLFERARDGDDAGAFEIYRWFLPLLRLDTVPEFVQLIKLVQQLCDRGNERVRAPRRPVAGVLRDEVVAMVRVALDARPDLERSADR